MSLWMKTKRSRQIALSLISILFAIAALLVGIPASTHTAHAAPLVALAASDATVTTAAAADTSRPLRDLAQLPSTNLLLGIPGENEDDGAIPTDTGFTGDGAVQTAPGPQTSPGLSGPSLTFEGLSNQDNANLLGLQVSPPDPNGAVGRKFFVEMVNLTFAVYSKTGTRLLGPVPLGNLWSGFAINDCTDLSGDPVVLYDKFADRWILTQFTTRGPIFYNCVAVSQTSDPTGAYFRYAFSTGVNFPDYPKYGIWRNAYFLATREFAPDNSFAGIGAYGLEREKMLDGDPTARAVKFLLPPGNTPFLTGDGLLPGDIDGFRLPPEDSSELFVGTMNKGAQYNAPLDALNIFQFSLKWGKNPKASFSLATQLPVAQFDSIFPCSPGTRSCIPQPGTTNKIDVLSYRQRPTFRLAYRNFGDFETWVTNQSVQSSPGVAGVRWYEIRRNNDGNDDRDGSRLFLFQQGTYAPSDGVNRWMGSVAMDRKGDIALGYSVSNGTNVFPGIRVTGRLRKDPKGQMTLGEAVLINGSGSQTVSTRWGDYTDMTVDPTDDCTFWYVNQYYQVSSARGWQTRIGSFSLPGCKGEGGDD
ncbi:MAG TPA: hypothetical protein VKY19_20090 [Ktedonosporobacter sp.]|jgi:hypothetical protein|nr:hypothetical protein [Ktedonosporobacter sp.]